MLTTVSSKEVLEIIAGLVRTFSAFTYNKRAYKKKTTNGKNKKCSYFNQYIEFTTT
jgi:hypothetical protein